MYLDSKLPIEFRCHLVKVKDASQDGQSVIGTFDNEPQQLRNPVSVCEAFLNCRSPEDVVRFTKRYGLLWLEHGSMLEQAAELGAPIEGLKFSFSVDDWYSKQYDLKTLWSAKTETGWSYRVGQDRFSGRPIEEQFVFSPKGTQFVFADLYRLIEFFIYMLPAERQKTCARPDCGKFFYANDLKLTYCGSLVCAHWGQLQSKRACWDRNKKKYLAQRG